MEHVAERAKPARSRTARAGWAIATAALATGLTLAACGSLSQSGAAGQTPQQDVTAAIAALGRQSSVTVRMSIPMTSAQARQLLDKDGATITPAMAQAVSTGSVVLTERTGHGEAIDSDQAQADQANSYAVTVNVGADVPLDVRYVDQSLYVRMDASQLATDTGQSPSQASRMQHGLAQANTFVPGLSALGQDKWVEASNSTLASLLPILKLAESEVPNPADLAASATKLGADLGRAVSASSSFARTAGSGDGDGYSVTVDAHKLLTTAAPDIQSTLGSIPEIGASVTSAINKAESSIPAGQRVAVHVEVTNGVLHQVDMDLNQLTGSQKGGSPVPLRLVFSTPGTVSAPAGAVQLDFSKLPSLLQGLMGGSSGS
jgi:hypothetical protein